MEGVGYIALVEGFGDTALKEGVLAILYRTTTPLIPHVFGCAAAAEGFSFTLH